MFTIAGRTCIGAQRPVNQDAYCVLEAMSALGPVALAAVCDGVGGLSSGELASSVAINELTEWFGSDFAAACGRSPTVDAALEEGEDLLRAFLSSLNERMYSYAQALGVRMGTTFTCAIMLGGRRLVAHVGDTRAYLLGDGSAVQLTEDDAAEGASNAISQALGSQEALEPSFYEGTYKACDLLVVCCDGLWRRVSLKEAAGGLLGAAVAGKKELSMAEGELIREALRRGERDNVTIACVYAAPREGRAARRRRAAAAEATTVLAGDAATAGHARGPGPARCAQRRARSV